MPKREDEYWAGMKEPKGRGLCPFCGRPNIYPSRRRPSWWECANEKCYMYGRPFPSPSYGPGGRVTLLYCPRCGEKSVFYNGKAAQYECLNLKCKATGRTLNEIRGYDRYMTPQETTRAAERYAQRQRRSDAEYPSRSTKGKGLPAWLVPGLVVFLLMMFGVTVWGLWGSNIADFFSSTSTSPPAEVSEPPTETPGGGAGVSVFDGKQPPFSETWGGEAIHLVNNKDATDPTWQQLTAFLLADNTDQKDYSLFSFPCGAFAEEVHNNAEAAGIRAAWVAVDFTDNPEVHALNAFETIDKGLVYVDCTGRDVLAPVSLVPTLGLEQKTFGEAKSWDKITYVEIGEEYGIISLEVALSPAYSYYEQHKQRVQSFKTMLEDYTQKVIAFNLEVEEYSRWLEGRVLYEGTAEALKAEEWFQELSRQENILRGIEEELDREGNSLGAFWEPLGIIRSVGIYW